VLYWTARGGDEGPHDSMQELEKEGRDRERKGWEMPREGERVTIFLFIYYCILDINIIYYSRLI
jgi:hypothetical protein